MRIFGLDLGTTSVGFAVIDLDQVREEGKILRLGARIFPEARDPDGAPLNQVRRLKRMMRRQLRRRRERRRSLNELLASHGLLPPFGGDAWRRVMEGDPYPLAGRIEIIAVDERDRPCHINSKMTSVLPCRLDYMPAPQALPQLIDLLPAGALEPQLVLPQALRMQLSHSDLDFILAH